MTANNYKKTKILNENERNVRTYTIFDESVFLKVDNIPLGFFQIKFKLL